MEPEPTVGRIVHYVAADGKDKAAIVIAVNGEGDAQPGTVDLAVFMHSGTQTETNVELGSGTEGTWHWPERV